jgi:urease accessory protein
VWRDDLVCGRHGEPSGSVRTDVTIRYADATLYRHELAVGPGAPGWSGAAVLGSSPAHLGDTGAGSDFLASGGRAVGSVIFAGADLPAAGLLGGDAAIMPLAGPGLLAMAIGADIRQVRAALDPLATPPADRTGDPSRPLATTAVAG